MRNEICFGCAERQTQLDDDDDDDRLLVGESKQRENIETS
jgi:hypothetical protein